MWKFWKWKSQKINELVPRQFVKHVKLKMHKKWLVMKHTGGRHCQCDIKSISIFVMKFPVRYMKKGINNSWGSPIKFRHINNSDHMLGRPAKRTLWKSFCYLTTKTTRSEKNNIIVFYMTMLGRCYVGFQHQNYLVTFACKIFSILVQLLLDIILQDKF